MYLSFKALEMIIKNLFKVLFSLTILLFLSSGPVLGGMIRCFETERRTLLTFKNELVDEYGRLSSWGVEENKRDCCKWRGVYCHNRTNHVTELDLTGPSVLEDEYKYIPSAPLRGKISPSLLGLQHLKYLDLSFNHFEYSTFPVFIASLNNLQYLNLSCTYINGSIPQHLGNLSKLLYLDLSQNSGLCSDNLDWVSRLYALKYLDLSHVRLSEETNWLEATSKLSSLEELRLSSCHLFSQNNLKGGIPRYSFGNSSMLRHLDLSRNQLTGQLSDLMMNMSGLIESQLEHLDLKENMISGALSNISGFAFLRELKLAKNQLNGSIPEGNLQLPFLVLLDLSSNKITGSVPDLSFSSSLKELYLHNNMFTGTITEQIRRLSTKLEVLFISSNHLEGTVTEVHLHHLSRLLVIDLSFNSFLTIKCDPQWIPPFQLKYMNLAHCKIGPKFPNWLRTQKELSYLDISDAKISDIVPSWFGNVTRKLVSLNASYNQIHGVFPNFSFPAINYRGSSGTIFPIQGIILDISTNKFSGSITFLCHTIGWRLLDLSQNLFSNQIPDCIGKFENLTYLNLANNHLFGKIPSTFGSLNDLSCMYLRNNSFFGEIPTSIRNCTSLQIMDLGENRLTGEIPTWIGNSSKIQVLSLRFNEFYGTIPSSLCLLENLKVLDLSSNLISGGIPKCLQNLTALTRDFKTGGSSEFQYVGWDSQYYGRVSSFSYNNAYIMWKGKEVNFVNTADLLTLVDLSSNTLVGEIPSEVTELVNLVALNLSRNNLTGPIPQNIGNLNSLQFLDFSRNHLSGGIPNSLSQLNLGVLDLSYNNLYGRIPRSTQLGTYDDAFIGNPGLCGSPLVKSCTGDETLQDDHPKFNGRNNAMDEEDDALITKGFYIAIGIGFFLGFWGIFGTFLISTSGYGQRKGNGNFFH